MLGIILSGSEARVQAVEASLPEAAVGLEPLGGVLQRPTAQPRWAKLRGSPEVLGAAGSIVQIEARHAAAIRLHRSQPPAPAAFDQPLQKPAVLKAVKPLIKA